ncbi:MAG: hypothetical protein RBS34_13590 [Desulfofustis sp.]|nr:hypothetical protein [Desulfofustis sp.]
MDLLNLAAYKIGSLQDARALLADARREGLTLDQALAEIDNGLPSVDRVVPAAKRAVRKMAEREPRCPSCGRFVMTRPKGVTEPVLVCPKCHYSEYRGVR